MGHFSKEQRGQITPFSLFILLLASCIFTFGIYSSSKSFFRIRNLSKEALCLKEYIGSTKRFMGKINQTNWLIQQLNRGKKIMSVIPGAQGLAQFANASEQSLKRYQDFKLTWYLKNLIDFKNKGCPFSPFYLQSPYKYGITSFQRRHDGVTKTRGKKWKIYITRPWPMEIQFIHRATKKKVKVKTNPQTALSSSKDWFGSLSSLF